MSALAAHGKNIASIQNAISSWSVIAKAANANGVDPAMLAAIGVRESNFEVVSQVGGYGEGVFQIDLKVHPDVTKAQADDVGWAANWAANYLSTNQAALAAKFPDFTQDQLQQATAASYNFGLSQISGNPATIDVGTTGNDYGSNVMAISKAFKDPNTGLTPSAGTANGGKDGC